MISVRVFIFDFAFSRPTPRTQRWSSRSQPQSSRRRLCVLGYFSFTSRHSLSLWSTYSVWMFGSASWVLRFRIRFSIKKLHSRSKFFSEKELTFKVLGQQGVDYWCFRSKSFYFGFWVKIIFLLLVNKELLQQFNHHF